MMAPLKLPTEADIDAKTAKSIGIQHIHPKAVSIRIDKITHRVIHQVLESGLYTDAESLNVWRH